MVRRASVEARFLVLKVPGRRDIRRGISAAILVEVTQLQKSRIH
jgi:hypothetical protein